jgi:hypothetical protein
MSTEPTERAAQNAPQGHTEPVTPEVTAAAPLKPSQIVKQAGASSSRT